MKSTTLEESAVKSGLTLISFAAFVLLFSYFHSSWDKGLGFFFLIPLITVSVLFGLRGGLIAGILAYPLHLPLKYLLGDGISVESFQPKYLVAWGAALAVGASIGYLKDASTRYRMAERLLRESEERFHTLSVATFEGIILTEKGIIIDGNQQFADMFGYELDDLLGEDVSRLVVLEDKSLVQSRILAGDETPCQYRATRKDGSVIHIEVRPRMMSVKGQALRVTAIRDITERVRTEKEREKLIRDLDAFAYTVAHDLKGPLSYMVGVAELLEQECVTLPREKRHQYLSTLTHGGHKMNNIIDELLLLAQVREVDAKITQLDMKSIVDEALRRLAYMIEEYQVELILPASWPGALGYSPWVEELWVNYISNAIKYGGHPPKVELGATVRKDAMVRFWVRDNGPGLTLEEQRKLFVPTERIQLARAEGHGLGLSIVKRIVDKLDGQAEVESEVGQGSVFSFSLRSH